MGGFKSPTLTENKPIWGRGNDQKGGFSLSNFCYKLAKNCPPNQFPFQRPLFGGVKFVFCHFLVKNLKIFNAFNFYL